MNISCLFVDENDSLLEKLKTLMNSFSAQVSFLKVQHDVDQIAEVIFEQSEKSVDLLLILGGVDVKSKAVSSTAVKRICDERVYTLETHLCELLAQHRECILTSATVGVRKKTLIVSLPQHEIVLKIIPFLLEILPFIEQNHS